MRGFSSIMRTPFAMRSAIAFSMLSTRRATCWMPSPFFSMYFVIGLSGAVPISSSISLPFGVGWKVVVTFCSATVS